MSMEREYIKPILKNYNGDEHVDNEDTDNSMMVLRNNNDIAGNNNVVDDIDIDNNKE